MRKSVKYLMLFLVISFATFVSIVIWFDIKNAHDKFENNITIEINGQTVKNFSIDNLSLTPGNSQEYKVNLVCKAEGTYSIMLDFNEDEEGNGGLKDYVDVNVFVDDELICVSNLKNLLEEDATSIIFSRDLLSKTPVVLKLVYTMSDAVKNEAQGTYADFDLKVTIDKE